MGRRRGGSSFVELLRILTIGVLRSMVVLEIDYHDSSFSLLKSHAAYSCSTKPPRAASMHFSATVPPVVAAFAYQVALCLQLLSLKHD